MAALKQLAQGRQFAVEVGTFTGASAEALLLGGVEHLLCVDTFRGVPTCEVTGAWSGRPELPLSILQRRLEPWAGRWTVIQGESASVAPLLVDEFADLIFLDAGHSYADVLADIEAWFPKVRPGGILAGHDFDKPILDLDWSRVTENDINRDNLGGYHFGVVKAVIDCFGEPGGIRTAPSINSSIWYVQKKDRIA